jgi:coenzyme F420-reducing hydrogenase beta subunit
MKEGVSAIEIIGENKCTGCFGCYNSCPQNAIQMQLSKDGFFVPHITNNCISCAKCQKHCPILQKRNNKAKFEEPLFFGGKSTDDEIILNSSSGGIFPEIAKYILKNSGVVYGAYMDRSLCVKHIKIEKIDQLYKLLGSKYLQSDLGFSYKEVLKDLKKGKNVLFTGTPCQIAALNSFKEKDNLYTIDLVCLGVPSKNLFKKYIDYMQSKKGKKIKYVNFRSKIKGWKDYHMKLVFSDDSTYEKTHIFDPFFKLYLTKLCLMNSCYNCKFNEIPRPGDISLGDFWGNPPSDLKDKNGVSIIVINSEKGKKLINKLEKNQKIKLSKTNQTNAVKKNPRLNGYKIKKSKERKKILVNLRKNNLEYILKKNFTYSKLIKLAIFRVLNKIKNK